MDQGHFFYYFKRGTLFLKQNELQRAEADLTSSIELNPKHHNSFHNRAIALFKLGQADKACDDWCQAAVLGNAYSGNYFQQNCAKSSACATLK
jgi:Tfp pilus assembly protein PilF